ncbi:hypothetical protein IFR04_012310 [Cadophora malorum]|uniref:Uncharacterized protein n=1 Tax=Cadophora malorum TaxID=108018 RepID=A0A8H7T7I5_9HELO|nr:hypothetical protein IFR04_012310 [Cadophora malorum]
MVRVSDIAGRSEGVEGLKSLAKSIADVVWLAMHDVRKSHIRAFLPEVIMEKTTDKFKVRAKPNWRLLSESEVDRKKEIKEMISSEGVEAMFPMMTTTVDIQDILNNRKAASMKIWEIFVITELLNLGWEEGHAGFEADHVTARGLVQGLSETAS